MASAEETADPAINVARISMIGTAIGGSVEAEQAIGAHFA
jgi:hypothetical protein